MILVSTLLGSLIWRMTHVIPQQLVISSDIAFDGSHPSVNHTRYIGYQPTCNPVTQRVMETVRIVRMTLKWAKPDQRVIQLNR